MLPPPVISNTEVYSTWYGQPFAHPSPPPPVDEHGRGPPRWQDSRSPMYAYPPYAHPGWIAAQSTGVYAPPQHFPYTSQLTPPIYTHPGAQQGPHHQPPSPRDTQ
ncbi:hypothetical protein BC629DRAFT_1484432 [Irpex lacteus]|nr:hypothetical protein BC629DRAFT_1484432 [Irpex lacteus]